MWKITNNPSCIKLQQENLPVEGEAAMLVKKNQKKKASTITLES